MNRIVPVVLSFAGGALSLSQKPPLSQSIRNLAEVSVMPEDGRKQIVAAHTQVLRKQDLLLKATQFADPAAVAEAQADLEAAKKAAAEVPRQSAPLANAQPVSRDQAQHLIQLVTGFRNEMKALATSAANWETGLIGSSLGFGLFSVVSSLMRWNRTSAVLSALVVIASGAPKIYPIHQRAVYFRTLTDQSYLLLSSLNLTNELMPAQYDDGAKKLQVLEDYGANKYPRSADIDSTTGDLLKDLSAVMMDPSAAAP
ncbi:MAG TPA: hypothetical protein VMT15_11435 [Bryobacteraceae bacterium]|nr:hypothetical protein [Bryobacteraceae bacterium]